MLIVEMFAERIDSLDEIFNDAKEFAKNNKVIVKLKIPKKIYDGRIQYIDINVRAEHDLESLCKYFDMWVLGILCEEKIKANSERRIEERKFKNRENNLNSLLENENGI